MRARSRLRRVLLTLGVVAAVMLAIVATVLVGGRTYVLSDSGRGLITSFVAGKKIGRYGRINVEGLSGDLFDDFTLARVTVEDEQGVWLEATNVRVDWSYWPLLARRFHASEITAERIRLIRRPVVEPPTEPGGPQPLAVDIDRFAADIELMEDFSREYGRWRLNGDADIPRRGQKSASIHALSLTRPGDHLRLAATFGGDIADLRLNLRAVEARGGPLAGSLGYSPNQPFTATAVVNGEVVDARVRTGDFTPLRLTGHYGGQGARIGGFFDFSGSDLLAPFVERIGRTARFGFAAVPVARAEGVQGMAWTLTADNIASQARGLIRTSDRSSPDGVRLTVATPSLTRLAGVGLGGATRYVGTFKGSPDRWSLEGRIDLADADLASYRAARVAGPLNATVRNGRVRLEGDVAAAGGSGEGMIGALLGAAPRLQLAVQRSPDGALLLEKIDARGQALAVTGQGRRSLDGGLNFRGEAAVTDVARIHGGARGAFGGAIRASSARSGAPWVLNFDGRGQGLATGMGELDRLLGRAPRLQLSGRLNDGRVAIERGDLTGAAGRASARGLIEPGGELRLALDWSATGPFAAGPVEIEGNMSGDGALTGTLAQPRADLRAAFERIAAGPLDLTNANLVLSFRRGEDASDGRIALTAGSAYGPARASGDFHLGGARIRLTDVDVNAGGVTAQGDIALSDRTPSSADLNFTARPGAFVAAGAASGRIRLTEGAGDDSAVVEVSARDLRLVGVNYTFRRLDLSGRGTLARLPFTATLDLAGAMPATFNGSGVYARADGSQTLTLRGGGRVREVAFATRSPAVLALSGDGRVARVDLTVGDGVLLGELRQDSRAAVIQADLTSVELGSLAPDVRGRITGRVSLRGAGDDLSGSANVTLSQLRSIDAPRGLAVDGALNATLVGGALRLQAEARSNGAVQAAADVTLPVEASAAPLRLAVARQRDMSGQVSAQGQIQPIWDLFLGGERSLSGQIDANATLAGSLNAPRITGRLNLDQGDFRDNGTGLRLADVTLRSRFEDGAAQIETFTATDGGRGAVSGGGRIGLRQGAASSLQLTLAGFQIIDNDIAKARASGRLTVERGADGDIMLSGEADIDDARIEANPPGSNGIVRMDVIEVNRPGGDPVQAEARAAGPQIGLDIRLRSPGGDVRVIGRGLNVELDVNARVRGTISRPQLTGTARVVRGDYEFAGKRFVFEERGTITLSTRPEQIRLDLAATRDDPALAATIRVTGTAARPDIALTSTPALPQDEILAQVLFGRSASQLSAFEAAQLASGVAALAGGGGFDVVGNLRELAGLDRLSFGGDMSALTVAGGRYITDDVYLEVIGGGVSGAAVNVQWQVRRNLTVSSKFGGQGDASLSIRWRRESGRPDGRRDGRPNRGPAPEE